MKIVFKNFYEIIPIFTFVIVCSFFYRNTIHLEHVDFDILHRIINPDSPKGKVTYDPHFNYLYLYSYLLEIFKIELNLLVKIIWFVEKIVTLMIIYLISSLIIKKKNYLIIAILYYFLMRGGQVDQKSFSLIFQLLSVYFFFNSKFIFSAFFLSIVFYFHVGMGLWWYMPSVFSFIYLIYKNEINYTIKDFLIYNSLIIFLILPIIYFYFFYINISSSLDITSLSEFWYGVNNSLYLFIIRNKYTDIFFVLSNFIFFIFSINILKDYLKTNFVKLVSIIFGISIIFLINEIIVNLTLNSTLLKLQILRSHEILFYFSLIFLSKILFDQIKRNNPIFFILFILVLIPNPLYFLLKYISFWNQVYIVWYLTLLYELLNNKFKFEEIYFIKRFFYIFELINFKKLYYFFVIFVFIFAITNQFIDLKKYLISVFNDKKYIHQKEYNLDDLIKFVNNIDNKEAIFMIPFNEPDFSLFINKKTLVTTIDVFDILPSKSKFMINFFKDEFSFGYKELLNKDKTQKLWNNLNEDDFINWNNKYGITHIIRESKYPLNFYKIFNDKKYHIYIIKK